MTQPRAGARLLMLGGALLAHVGIFAGLFRGVYSLRQSGTGLFYEYAGRILHGQLPYRDFFAEYPPLALAFFTLPRMLGESFRWYYVWYQVEVVLADLLIVLALFLAARRWSLSEWRLIVLYSIAVLAVGPINLQQFDIFPAAFSLLSVLWFVAGGAVGAGVLLALGVMTKVYPILLAPVFVLLAWPKNRRSVLTAIAAFIGTCLVILIPWLVESPSSLREMFRFHADRGIHLDSVYSTIAFAGSSLGIGWVDVIFNFRSWNIAGPFVNVLASVSTFVLLIVLAAVYVLVYRSAHRRAEDASADVEFVGHAAFLVLLAAMAASKVLSPQYLVWFTPFAPFIIGPRRRAVWFGIVATGLLTYYLYPVRYEALLRRETSAILLLAARNCALLITAILAAISLRRADVGVAA
jgi:uncharacterized membrane protein